MAEVRLRSHGLIRSALAAIIVAVGYVAVVGLNQTTWAANCDANRVNCNSSEWQAYNDCASGDVGAIWFNTGDRGANNTGGYYTDVVNIDATTNSVTVKIRGSACNRDKPSGYDVYATDIRPGGDSESQRLSMSGGTILGRGSFNGNIWTTMGSDLTATLNVSGLATNNIGKEDNASITVQLGRCYNGSASNRGWDGTPNGRCYYNPVVVNIHRDARPNEWTINAQSYIKKSNSSSENTDSGFSQPASSINASPGEYIYWKHDLRVENSYINQNFAWTMRWTGFPSDFNNGGNQYIHWNGNVNEPQNSLFVRRGALPNYDPSYTIYQVRSSDAGSNLCQRIEWAPTAWNNGAASGTTYRCAYVPYNFSLVPSVISPADGTIIESDQDIVNVTGQIANNGPTKSGTDVSWRITQINYAPSVTTIPNRGGGTGGDPCSYFTGKQSCNVLNQGNESGGFAYPDTKSYSANNGQLSNNPVGTKICFVLSVNKYSAATMGNANAWRHSALNCLIVGKKPKVQVWGGGVSAGKVFNGTSLQSSSKVATSVTQKNIESTVTTETQTNDATKVTGFRGTATTGSSDPNWTLVSISKNGDTSYNAHCQSDPVGGNALLTSDGTLVSNSTGRNQSSSACPFPGLDGPGPVQGDNGHQNREVLPDDVPVWTYRLKDGFSVDTCVDLNTLSVQISQLDADDDVELVVNGKVARSYKQIRESMPQFTIDKPRGIFRSTIQNASFTIGPLAVDGSQLFNHGSNTLEVRVKSAWQYTGWHMRAAPQAKTANCTVTNNTSVTRATTFGSWSEYGIYAPSTINLMASSSGLNGGSTSNSQSSWSKLTFTNQITSPTGTQTACASIKYGCYYADKKTLPDPSSTFPYGTAVQQPGSSWNISTLMKGRNIRPSASVTTLNLISNSTTLNSGEWLVINAPNATVNITSDLRYTSSGSLSRADQIPQLIIIAGRINIASNVTQVDAWLIAKNGSTLDGRINTCSTTNAGADLPITQNLSSSLCDKALRVNGPVVANMLYLRRTAGSGVKEQSGDPAEVFNLRPDSYIWARSKTESLGSLTTTYMVELPPRY